MEGYKQFRTNRPGNRPSDGVPLVLLIIVNLHYIPRIHPQHQSPYDSHRSLVIRSLSISSIANQIRIHVRILQPAR